MIAFVYINTINKGVVDALFNLTCLFVNAYYCTK